MDHMSEENIYIEEEFNQLTLISYLGFILFGFSILCFFTSAYFSSEINQSHFETSNTGGTLSPLTITDDHTVCELTVSQQISTPSTSTSKFGSNYENWSYISIDVLDENDHTLYNLGNDLWSASGVDQGYGWSESDLSFDTKITFEEKGTYYIDIKTESPHQELTNKVIIDMKYQNGSSLPHKVLGILSLLVSIGMLLFVYIKK